MPVRSRLLAAGFQTLSGRKYLYTTPPGYTTIVKEYRFFSWAPEPYHTELLAITQSGAEVRLFAQDLVQYTPATGSGWTVLPPGATLVVDTFAAGNVHWWVSGTELEGVSNAPVVPVPGTLPEQGPPRP